jgi:hypothetical protein
MNRPDTVHEARVILKLTQIVLFCTFNFSDLKRSKELADNKIKNLITALNEQTLETVFDIERVSQFISANCFRVV